ncbi:hypothetical protein ACIUY9_01365 [Pseudomonas aeruginosa]
MSEVKKISPVGNIYGWEESQFGEFVLSQDYDDLAAESQALREERDSQQRVAIKAMEELAALRARVVVVPERKSGQSTIPGLHMNRGWNACLDELSRLNGLTVSEGLLRRIVEEQPAVQDIGEMFNWQYARDQAMAELRVLLNQDKENGNG